jgi:hypothetical protein
MSEFKRGCWDKTNQSIARLWIGLCSWLLTSTALFATGCASMHESPDFQRHRLSQVVVPSDKKDLFYFDVSVTPEYPDDDPAAEETRLQWLEQWLDTRGMCSSGFEILKRRPFEFLEDNPARYDLRYEVRCRTEPVG